MKRRRLFGALFILSLTFHLTISLGDPLTWGLIAGGIAGIYSGVRYLKCIQNECCTPTWITPNTSGLENALMTQLHGQHLVKNVIIKSIKAHLRKKNPSKPLVLSFHGWTGGGKTYVSKLIAENLYVRGSDSNYFHLLSGSIHFPHANRLPEYRENLLSWIRGNVSECQQSIFIFDEVDKMPPGLFDYIKPYLDYHNTVDGVNFRHAVFILLSNTGGEEITKVALDFWKQRKPRENIVLKDLNHILSVDAFNVDGGLQHSSLIDKHLIDHFIPFLPLERRHVKQCIADELIRRNIPVVESEIVEIADMLDYWPNDLKIYSTVGCKRIEKLIDYHFEN